MQDLMMIFAAAMPEEMIIEEIGKAIDAYKADPCKDTKGKLAMYCMLFASKETIDTTEGGLDSVLARMDKVKKGFDLLDVDPKNTHS